MTDELIIWILNIEITCKTACSNRTLKAILTNKTCNSCVSASPEKTATKTNETMETTMVEINDILKIELSKVLIKSSKTDSKKWSKKVQYH